MPARDRPGAAVDPGKWAFGELAAKIIADAYTTKLESPAIDLKTAKFL